MVIIGILVLLGAAWSFDWRTWLGDKTRHHLCFGAAIALVPLWMLQAGVKPGLEVHFLGLTTLALLLGWRMGLMMSSLSLLLVTAFGFESWSMLGPNLLLGVVIPLSASYLLFLLTYSYLYRHLFVYIFVAGFFNAALTITLKTLLFSGFMVWSDQYSWQVVVDNYLSVLPLLLFPEALLNGMAITVLVLFKPEWVCTYRDRDYIINK
ncbi:energy-coupling factor ABC transporter permease [Oceanisphaera sp. IT1-181]|uniref:energy-coupling factor ABC transporter permease n=1 Tax=Oceanisphaera sp. IT1-181 TaxID=3081199 RepID=UPI0029C9B70C|nr:energy-coupling factor ABC transporter permease [Oceanisphaera sp. IT1-181]